MNSKYRFVVLGLSFLVVLLNYFDRAVISYAVTPISEEFGWGNTGFGLAMSMFAVGTVAANGVSGWLLDRRSVKKVWTVTIFFWSVVMLLLGAVHIVGLFLLLRFLLGVGEGATFPAMNRSVANWMKPEELSRATSMALLGVPMAMLLGSPIFATLITDIGWRWTFFGLGLVGVVVGGAMVIWYRDPSPRELADTDNEPDINESDINESDVGESDVGELVPWRDLLKDRTLLATSWSFFAFGYVLFFAITWIPGYFEQTYDLDLQQIGWFATLPWALAIVLMLIAGWLSDRVMKRTGQIRASRVHIIWIAQLVAALLFVPLLFEPSSGVAVVFLSLAIGFSMMPNSPYYAICNEVFSRNSGAATGIMVTFFSVSGIVSPLLTGWLSDIFDGFAPAFGALIAIVGSAVVGMVLFARPDQVR